MSLNNYQTAASKTAIYPGSENFVGLSYVAHKLASEAGEVSGKIGKIMLAGGTDFLTTIQLSTAQKEDLARELGDVLWYVAMGAKELGFTLQSIADMNIQKLADRQSRNILVGSGDNR